ncbi:MAG: endonuclease [Gaiellales bacterium]
MQLISPQSSIPARAVVVPTATQPRYAQLPLDPGTKTAAHQAAGGADLAKYYAPAQGKEGAALLRALHLIVRTGHVDRGYAQARDEMFSGIDDVNNDNHVEDIFTGERYGPITGRKDAFSKGINTEHTWPQSKGATGIAQSDLHHLRPANVITNQMRGSSPYGDVKTPTWTVGEGAMQARLGVDALGTTVFEPAAANKGDIARGLLYFYTRYAQSRPGNFTLVNFKHELPTLLRWHKEDPVSDVERMRNDGVQQAQGNRNPFVDHPEFVDKLQFTELGIDR